MSFLVTGGSPLYGSVSLRGAKNAALPILFASLLCQDSVTLCRLPQIGDVEVAIGLLKSLGVQVEKKGVGLSFDTQSARAPTEDCTEVVAVGSAVSNSLCNRCNDVVK